MTAAASVMRGLAFALALLAALPAAAQDCAGTQTEMNECAQKSFKQADAKLNAAYKDVIAHLAGDPGASRLLVEAQRAWLKFRDAECAFSASGSSGGSVYPMIVVACREGLTEARLKQLQAYQHCVEGDFSCPVPPAGK